MNLFRKELDLFIVHKAFVWDDDLKLIYNILFDIWCILIYKFFINIVKIIRTASFWASVHTKIRNEIVYDVYPIFVDCLEISKLLCAINVTNLPNLFSWINLSANIIPWIYTFCFHFFIILIVRNNILNLNDKNS